MIFLERVLNSAEEVTDLFKQSRWDSSRDEETPPLGFLSAPLHIVYTFLALHTDSVQHV